MRVGFIGLGSQGAPMARRIVEGGYDLTLARRRAVPEPFADSAKTAQSPAELAAASVMSSAYASSATTTSVFWAAMMSRPDPRPAGWWPSTAPSIPHQFAANSNPLLGLRLPGDRRLGEGGGLKAEDGKLLPRSGRRP